MRADVMIHVNTFYEPIQTVDARSWLLVSFAPFVDRLAVSFDYLLFFAANLCHVVYTTTLSVTCILSTRRPFGDGTQCS